MSQPKEQRKVIRSKNTFAQTNATDTFFVSYKE